MSSWRHAPFLYRAARETTDAAMREVAFHHADHLLGLHRRADDSFIQSIFVDPRTGAMQRQFAHKGYSDTSA